MSLLEGTELDSIEMGVELIPQQQLDILWRKTPPHAVRTRQGPGGRMLSYLPHGYVEDVLNKALGGDWDFDVITDAFDGRPFELTVVETPVKDNAKPVIRRMVSVVGHLLVRVRDPKSLEIITTISKTEFGSATWDPAIEFGDALKSASSDAFKRCGFRLGIGADQYYDDDHALQQYNDRRTKELSRLQEQKETERNTPPTNVAEMFIKAKQMFGLDAVGVCASLGFPSMAEGGIGIISTAFAKGEGEALWNKLKETSVMSL